MYKAGPRTPLTFTSEGLPPPPHITCIYNLLYTPHNILPLSLSRSPAPHTAHALSSFSAGCNELPISAQGGCVLLKSPSNNNQRKPQGAEDRQVGWWVGGSHSSVETKSREVKLELIFWRSLDDGLWPTQALSQHFRVFFFLLALIFRVLLGLNSCFATVLCKRQGREVWG